jgi:aspartate aminotransferase
MASESFTHALSPRLQKAMAQPTPMGEFFATSAYRQKKTERSLDFTLGDAHEAAPAKFVEILQRHLVPQNERWFGYLSNLSESRAVVAASLQKRRGMPFAPEDIFLTNGTAVGLSLCLHLLAGEGDEVTINTPPWLGYRRFIHMTGATPIGVPVEAETFDLDLEAIASAITARTRAIIVNSPHNPTGKLFSAETLQRLATLLTTASERYGHPIYLISDEAFSRILFDGQPYISPTQFYPLSFLVYGTSKTLMTPGQRLGYLALPPTMPNRDPMRTAIAMLQGSMFGWCFPSALMQHALAELEEMTLDIEHLQHKRDWLVGELRAMGYELRSPEGTFFLLVKSPCPDDCAFAERLADLDIFVLPGTPQEIPGYFRLSLTVSEETIACALPKFRLAIEGERGK